jgi:pimeloyl-ACP methyl ester carboxylesterase
MVFSESSCSIEQKHDVYPLTLTGLGDRQHLLTASINLDTHIQDVIGFIKTERLTDVILCGHSYGGMVISGVADSVPEFISSLVYIDAYVPADGESCWDLANETFRQMFIEGASFNGYAVNPPPRLLDSRATPHPLASFVQKIRLKGNPANRMRHYYIYLSNWNETPFTSTYERLRNDPTWNVFSLPFGHNIMAEAPDKLLELLLMVST